MVAKADLLKEALHVVEKRGLTYGQAENNFARIAALWTVYYSQRVVPEHKGYFDETDVAAMMALMKIARLMEKPDHYDSWLDLAGYAACGSEVSGAKMPDATKPPLEVIREAELRGAKMAFDATGNKDAAEKLDWIGKQMPPIVNPSTGKGFVQGAHVRQRGTTKIPPREGKLVEPFPPAHGNWVVAWDGVEYHAGNVMPVLHERDLELI